MPNILSRLLNRGIKFLMYETLSKPQSLTRSYGYEEFNFEAFCDKMSLIYNNHPKVKSAVISTAGQVMAEGIFLEPAQRRDEAGRLSTYDRAEEARQRCEELNDRLRINELGFAVTQRMVKYGSCFIEKTFEPQFDVKIIPDQKYIKPKYSKSGDLVGWRLHYRGVDVRTWPLDRVIHIPLFPDENTPYGTSIAAGIGADIETYEHIINGMKKWVERQAFATDVVQIGDKDYVPGETEMNSLRRNVRNRTIGDTIFTNYSVGKQTLGGGQLESTSIPRMMDFIDKHITDGLMAPPLSSLVSSTEASATQVIEWLRAILITPIQSIISTTFEKELYWSYLEDLGYSVRVVPRVMFNSAEAGKNREADYWLKLVQAQIASPRQAAGECGIEWDKDWWEKHPIPQSVQPFGGVNKVAGDIQRQATPTDKTGPKPQATETVDHELASIDEELEWMR